RERECSGDQRLRGDDRRDGREHHESVQAPCRRQLEERIAYRAAALEEQRALPEVIEQQRREGDGPPRGANRPCAEMPYVGIQCFGAGDHQDNGAMKNPCEPWRKKCRTACIGSIACSTEGCPGFCRMTCTSPIAPIVPNQSSMVGPKIAAIPAVPCLCTEK